ncbi:MAG: type II toxin-antitoxin system VapC family toxin [Coriobacteriales bacterium]|jgi:PIN domain nuclease of toxin-antitoxin system|nr:type II toxin-antitoxin system VapC family toxin [Coriobacteriales bacterium]
MRLLLDTNVLLFGALGELPKEADALINDLGNEVHYSSAAIWEITIKARSGKLELNMPTKAFENELLRQGYRPLGIAPEHAHQTAFLIDVPGHKDPFDRIMVAQSICEGMLLVTTDQALAAYGQTVRVVGRR